MKKQVEIFVQIGLSQWNLGDIFVHQSDMASVGGYHTLCKQAVEMDIPDFDIVQIQVDGIEQQIVKLRAEFQSSLKQLEDRKAELLAIGHDTEEV